MTFYLLIYLYVVGVRACVPQHMFMWKSKDNLGDSALSLQRVGPRD